MLEFRYLIDREVNRLYDILRDGLPAEFEGDYDRYMGRWCLEFSQNRHIVKEFEILLNSFRWVTLSMKIEEKYGYNFVDTVRKAVSFFNDELPKPGRNEWRKRIVGANYGMETR